MWKKIIFEILLASTIIFLIMGIPTKTTTTTKTNPAKDSECWCSPPEKAFKDIKAKYLLSDAQFDIIYNYYYKDKLITTTEVKHVVSYWCDRLLILAAYFLLCGLISAILSSNSRRYWYYFLPLTELICFIIYFPKNYKEKKINRMESINIDISNKLSNIIEKLNSHFNRG